MEPTELHLTIYVAGGADPDRVIDGLNDVMLVMVDEGLIADDLTRYRSDAEEGEVGWSWMMSAATRPLPPPRSGGDREFDAAGNCLDMGCPATVADPHHNHH